MWIIAESENLKGESSMLILTAAQTAQPDYVALAIVLALFVVVAIMVIRKRFFNKTKEQAPVAAPVEVVEAPVAPGSAGPIKLYNVAPKTAAMLMAIVADKTGKPLNELRFISIREVE